MPKNKFWNFKNKDTDTGELMLYGDIAESSWWGDEITPAQFKKDLDGLGDIKNLNIYINSGGGDIFAGQTIHSMLQRHKAYKTVYVDGLAASIASVVAMSGDKIIMPKGSMLMIHNGMIGLMGYLNAEKLRKYADMIEKITDSAVVPAYERSKQTTEKIKEMMNAETWLSAQEAVDMGFADEIEENKQLAASIKGGILMLNSQQFELERYKNKPEIAEYTPLPNENGGESQPASDKTKQIQSRDEYLNKKYERMEVMLK